jgi:outer membrane protein assembly factor BamB
MQTVNVISRTLTIAGFLAVACWPSGHSKADWNRFRGTNGQGVIEQCKVPLPWTESDVAWKIDLPGKGNGSPIAVGKKVFIMSAAAENQRYALAYDLVSGKELWRKSFATPSHKVHAKSSYASCTPCANSNAVFYAWASPENLTVKAFSHEGDELWTKDFGRYISAHGFGGSPVLVDDMLILSNNQDAEELPPGVAPGDSSILALDVKSGNVIWETPRKSVRTCYGAPSVLEDAGKKVLIFAETGDGVFALDAATGKQLWNNKVFTKRSVSCPVIVGDIAISTEGSGGGGNILFGVNLKGDHELAFEIKNTIAPYVPTPVAKGELLFLWADKGIVTCASATNGETFWSERIGGNVSTSPVIAGDKLIGIDEEGTVTILSASRSFQELGKVKLGEMTRSTPLLAEDYILIRTDSKLICVGKPQ